MYVKLFNKLYISYTYIFNLYNNVMYIIKNTKNICYMYNGEFHCTEKFIHGKRLTPIIASS